METDSAKEEVRRDILFPCLFRLFCGEGEKGNRLIGAFFLCMLESVPIQVPSILHQM